MKSTDPNQSPGNREEGVANRIADAGREALSGATQDVRSRVEQSKSTAAESATATSEVLEHAAEEFSEHGQETLARATRYLSSRLTDLAHQIEHRSIDDLSREAMRLARDNPGLFIAGGIAIGLALSRFMKATAPEHRSDYGGHSGYGAGDVYGQPGYGQPGYGSGQPTYPSDQPGYGSTPPSYGAGYGSGQPGYGTTQPGQSDPTYGSEAAVPSQGSGGGGQAGEGSRGPARAPGSNRGATGGSESGNPMGSGGLHE